MEMKEWQKIVRWISRLINLFFYLCLLVAIYVVIQVFDVMKYYMKRCVALPGDILEIRNGYYKIHGENGEIGSLIAQQQIATLPDSGTNVVIPCFPWSNELQWAIKEFGSLPVPAKGQVAKMNSLSCTLYRLLIQWEHKQLLRMIYQIFL